VALSSLIGSVVC